MDRKPNTFRYCSKTYKKSNICDRVMKVTLVMKVLNIKVPKNTNLMVNNQ